MTRHVLAAVAVFAAVASPLCAQDIAAILADTGLDGGLAVHVGATDGRLESFLAEAGRWLVHGLAADETDTAAARRTIIERGLYGLASVETWRPADRLPYAANLVNLLIADAAAIARFRVTDAEVMRVVAPGGVACLKQGGEWVVRRKPWPPELDHWTHFDYDCTNNAVSHDRQVGPVTGLQWIEGYRSLRYEKDATGAVRSWGGVLVHEIKTVVGPPEKPRSALYLAARDAFNGLGCWFMPVRSTSPAGLQSIVVADGTVFTMANPDDPRGPMRAYDLRTGRQLLSFTEGGLLETEQQAGGSGHAYASGAPRWVRILYHNGTLYQTAGDSLYALDARTGKRRWQFTDADGRRLLFPTLAPDLGLVFVAHTERARAPMPNDWCQWNSRWPASRLLAISAFDAGTGRLVWRNTDVAGQAAGQLVYSAGSLAYFSASGIGAMGGRRDEPSSWTWVGCLDAASGKLRWSRDYRAEKPEAAAGADVLAFAFTLALRDGRAYVVSQNHLVAFDLRTGRAVEHLAPPIPNARCTRPRATLDYYLMGFGTFVASDMRTTFNQNFSRSDCMTGPTPANGMVYHTPNGCTCFAMLRGFAAYAREPPWDPLPAAARLTKGDGRPPPALVKDVRKMPPVETFTASGRAKDSARVMRLPVFNGSPIRAAWISNDVLPYPETEPVALGDLSLVAVVNEHRLEARRGDSVAWAFVAGGRISTPPLVHQGRVYVASHDGCVTCLDGSSGRLLWRFLAAPNTRRVVAYGQLESAWPVYGLCLHEGLIAASAGRHPELDGGIYVYGLDPATGEVRWQGRVHTDLEAVPMDAGRPVGKPPKWRQPANTIVNATLQVRDGKLLLTSADMTNEGTSRPAEHYAMPIDPASPPR